MQTEQIAKVNFGILFTVCGEKISGEDCGAIAPKSQYFFK